MPAELPTFSREQEPRSERAPRAVRVVMFDGAAIVPYYTGHLCAALREAGLVEPELFSITYRHDPGFFVRSGVRTRSLLDISYRTAGTREPLRTFLKAAEYLVNLGGVTASAAWRRPDAVHVQFLPLVSRGIEAELWCLRFLRALRIPLVHTVHNVLPHDTHSSGRHSYYRLYALADRLICHDADAAVLLATEFGVSPDRIDVIPHGPMFASADHMDQRRAKELLGFRHDQCLVLCQGIIRPYKGVDLLVDAWREVCAVAGNPILAIVGTGDRTVLEDVESRVRAHGVGARVRLDFRFVSVEELARYHNAADILVYPYREITTSGALMTGILWGKPVIAADLAPFRELLTEGRDALLFPPGDTAALARALVRVTCDERFRRNLSENAERSRRNLPGWNDIAAKTFACYG
jgi:glycosyltransferase involved in cell wall biosynthesis